MVFISCKGLCTQFMWLDLEFQFTATTIMSMAARSSDLEDRTSEANLQTEGLEMCCPKVKRALKRYEHWTVPLLPSWSPARRPLPSHPNTRYCLGIHVTLTEETGVVHPLSQAWTVPLVEDMLCYARTGLTKAMVTGPGRAVLFYGRHSLGEGLSPDESRNAAFMLTGAGTWVGKPAYLTTDPLTIKEGCWEIAQAITKCQIKARDPGCPHVNPLTPQPFRFNQQGDSPWKDTPRDVNSDHQLLPCQPPRGRNHNWGRRDLGLPPLQSQCHPQITGLKVIGVQPPPCCHCQTGQKAPGIPGKVDNVGRLESTWKVIYPSLKMRTQRMLWPTRVGGGIWWYTVVQDAEIVHSCHMPFGLCKVTLENWCRVWRWI